MSNKPIGTPRFYVDFSQLARVKGMWSTDFDSHSRTSNLNSPSSWLSGNAAPEAWLGDYTTPKTYYSNDSTGFVEFIFTFYYESGDFSSLNDDWSKLMEKMDYVAVVNHNLLQAFPNDSIEITARRGGSSSDGTLNHPNAIEGDNIISNHNGFYLGSLSSTFWSHSDTIDLDAYRRNIAIRLTGNNMTNIEFKIGSMMFGTIINMPFAPNLGVKKSVVYDGLDIKRGVSGSDIVHIENQGLPNFTQGSPWKNYDYSLRHGNSISLGEGGRRRWDLKFSYISENTLFTNNNHDRPSGSGYDNGGSWISYSAEGEIERLYNYTLGGALPFLFCPDPEQTNPEYAMCRFTSDGFKATQNAHNVWDISMGIEEIW